MHVDLTDTTCHTYYSSLEKGDIAVATARNPSQLGIKDGSFSSLKIDVTNSESMDKAFGDTISHFGKLMSCEHS